MSTTELLRVSLVTTDDSWHVRLVGEADFSVVGVLAETLQGVTPRQGQDVRLDLSGLEFVDLACMRELIRFARRAERVGARVLVVHPNPSFTILRGLLGPDIPQVRDPGPGRGASRR
jgi:anti-anti-sigma regulatory factor